VCVCVCVFTLTDSGCEVLQESVIQQLGEVVQDKDEAGFGVALTNQFLELLVVGLTARVVLYSQTSHLEGRKGVSLKDLYYFFIIY